jgi:hypothetical protein
MMGHCLFSGTGWKSKSTEMNAVSTVKTFCKTARCPSSEMLLSYRRQRSTITDQVVVQRHLQDCDFCSAELELLKRHKHEIEETQSVEMPSQVRRLAENLFLKQKTFLPMTRVLVYTGRLSH